MVCTYDAPILCLAIVAVVAYFRLYGLAYVLGASTLETRTGRTYESQTGQQPSCKEQSFPTDAPASFRHIVASAWCRAIA